MEKIRQMTEEEHSIMLGRMIAHMIESFPNDEREEVGFALLSDKLTIKKLGEEEKKDRPVREFFPAISDLIDKHLKSGLLDVDLFIDKDGSVIRDEAKIAGKPKKEPGKKKGSKEIKSNS